MWFRWDGAAILIPTNHATQKARNLERDPHASVMIDDSRQGFDLRGITVMGEATPVRAPGSLPLNRSIHLPTRAFAWDLRQTTSGSAASG
jgi:hypothetical protein